MTDQNHIQTPQEKGHPSGSSRLGWGLGVAIVLALFWLYWRVTDHQMVGFLHDDGVYALTAKALAWGKGYKLLNLPMPDSQDFTWQVKYPIGYPLILSLAWLIQPNFPQNLPWLQGLTIVCAVIAIPLLYGYLRHAKQAGRKLAILICVLVAANFHYIYYATSLMSEAPYFLWSLLTLWLAETGDSPPSKRRLAGMILASTFAFHTRTLGLALIAAIFLAQVLRQQWKRALVFLGVTLLLTVIPWMLWVKGHSMTVTPLSYPLAYVYGGYGIEYGINAPHDWLNYLLAFITRGLEPVINTLSILILPQIAFWLGPYPLASGILALGLTGCLLLTGIQSSKNRQFSASGLYLTFYILGISLWMYPNQVIRFLIEVLPWLWLYSIRGGLTLAKACMPRLSRIALPQPAAYVAVLLTGAFLLWPCLQGYNLLHRIRSQHLLEPSGKTAPLWQDYQAAFQYVRQNTQPTERIASIWDPVFYLYTGHPTFGLFSSSLQPINGQITPESFQRLRDSFIHYQVKYIVVEPFIVNQQLQLPENPIATTLIQQFPQDFQPAYRAPSGLIRIYRFRPH